MKNKLFIHTDENSFYIKTNQYDLKNLRISKMEKEKIVSKTSDYTWRIGAQDFQKLITYGEKDRIFIYVDNKDQIDVNNFDLSIDSDSFIKIGDQIIYLYISFDNQLRFLVNQKPSLKRYYIGSKINHIFQKNDFLQIDISISSKFLPFSSSQFIIKNRKEGYQTSINNTTIKNIKLDNNFYETCVSFQLYPSIIMPIIHPNIDYNTYDTTVLDFYICVETSKLPLTKINYRLPFFEKKPIETSCSLSTEIMILFNWYSTTSEFLSSRIGTLKKEVYEYYSILDKSKKSNIDNKKIILITEYPHKAQENGFFLFKYLMEKQSDFIPYYIITKDSADLINLTPYMKNVVYYKSKEHLKLLFSASYLAHSHTSEYALPFYSRKLLEQNKELKKIFLQHGITASKNINSIYGKTTNPNLIDIFLVSSDREKEQIHHQLHYPYEEIKITGLARFDSLLAKNYPFKNFFLRKKVLIMPSWRRNQVYLSDEEFKKTRCYKTYNELINDSVLKKLVSDENLQIDFYLHNNYQMYSHLFKSDFINILTSDNYTVQKLLKGHGVLITDYSSVGLDFSLLKRKVLYYQFDDTIEEVTDNVNENYSFLPGPVFKTKTLLIEYLKKAVKNNYLEKKYRTIVTTKIYKFQDQNACKRIYEVIKNLDK